MYRRAEIGQVARALRVLDSLRGFKRGRRVSDLAAEVGASERTVRRDLAELQDAGFDIELSKVENRSMARLIEQSYSSIPITRRERFTLLAVRSVFEVLRGTPFLDDVHSVLAKLEQRMSEKEREEHAAFGERFIYLPDHGTKSYEGKDDIIDAIQTGILSRKVVRYRYAGARGRSREGFVAPYAMILYRHGLYAVGGRLTEATADIRTSELGVFAIERFTEAEHLRSRDFEIPSTINIRELLHGSFGVHLGSAAKHDVVIEFSREKAPLVVTRVWHPAQRVEHGDEGRVRLSFACADLAPVVSWVLEWGPHAKALAPQALAKLVKAELDGARARYED